MNKTAALVASLALVGQAPPAAAQAGNAQHVQSLANLYALTDYALGANEGCDLFTLGAYRALVRLRFTVKSDLRRALKAEQWARIASFDKGKSEWRGCLTRAARPDPWKLIDSARLVADALIAAPSKVSSEPKDCQVDGEYAALSKMEWSYPANAVLRHYVDDPRKAEFEALSKDFAAMIDVECKRTKYSALMQAGYESLLHSEDLLLMFQKGPGPKRVLTSAGTRVALRPLSLELGVWRSRRGGFTGSRLSAGLNVYRILDRADKEVVFFHLSRPGTFDPRGMMYITRTGRWVARMKSNIDELELRLSDGSRLPLAKQSGSGNTAVGAAEFTLPAAHQTQLGRAADDHTATLAYRVKGKEWTEFLDIGRTPGVQKQKIGDIRASLAWANAPMPAKEDRQ